MAYCYHYSFSYSSSFYYHHNYYYYFILPLLLFSIITIFCCYYSHHYYCSQYYQCYFILSHFNFYGSYYYDFCLCIACDLYVSFWGFLFSYPFLVNDLRFILALLIHVKNHFSFVIIVYIIIFIITIISLFSAIPVIVGEFSKWIRAVWPTPTHWLLWVSHRVSIIFIFYLFIFLFTFVSSSLVTTVEVLIPSFIFII